MQVAKGPVLTSSKNKVIKQTSVFHSTLKYVIAARLSFEVLRVAPVLQGLQEREFWCYPVSNPFFLFQNFDNSYSSFGLTVLTVLDGNVNTVVRLSIVRKH